MALKGKQFNSNSWYFLIPSLPVAGSLSPSSVAASRLEAALSEVSDVSSTRRQGPTYIWATLERIWLQAGMTIAHTTITQFLKSQGCNLFSLFWVQMRHLPYIHSVCYMWCYVELAEQRNRLYIYWLWAGYEETSVWKLQIDSNQIPWFCISQCY